MTTNHRPPIDTSITPDELLTTLAEIPPQLRSVVLNRHGIDLLRLTADFCGINAEDFTKRQVIAAIVENF